jgi:hypothetical protein
MEEASTLPPAWRRPSTTSDWHLRLTPERAHELMKTIYELMSSWQESDEDAEDTAEFVVHLHAFPRPGTLTPVDPAATDGQEGPS